MLASQQLAEIRIDRLERERIERELYNDARYELCLLGFGSQRITDILEVAKRRGVETFEVGGQEFGITYAAGYGYTIN